MSVWALILFSAATALLFRLLPIAFGRIAPLQDTGSALYRFLNYSSQAMLGAMCFTMAFGRQDVMSMIGMTPRELFIVWGLLLAAGLVVARTGYILTTVLAVSGIYALSLFTAF